MDLSPSTRAQARCLAAGGFFAQVLCCKGRHGGVDCEAVLGYGLRPFEGDCCAGSRGRAADFRCGLWLFTREPEPHASVMTELMAAVKAKGISTQSLVAVNHTGCSYQGFEIK